MGYPGYVEAFENKVLQERAEAAYQRLENCSLCPRKCGVNRLAGERGFCRTGKEAIVYSSLIHHGEEPAISGERGSGTIFFAGCSLKCLYCQNHSFSQSSEGSQAGPRELAGYMLDLQASGCHNINFVTPTHVIPQILRALVIAVEGGLNIPLVYNTSGYELTEMIELLRGVFDIYLPDARYADDLYSREYSLAPGYPQFNQAAIKEMYRQVGRGEFDEAGVMRRGLVVRHLVLPKDICGTEKIFAFLAGEISPKVYISLMSQYFPCFEAGAHPPLDRPVSLEEYERAVELMAEYGLENGWIQESGGLKRFAGTHIKRNV